MIRNCTYKNLRELVLLILIGINKEEVKEVTRLCCLDKESWFSPLIHIGLLHREPR